ncbi:MAG TPA: integrase, partial [Actinomycetota bacterium]|nr:integrase [Actinomycetota bacterium]
PCSACGQLRRHAAFGLCGRCWQRHPDRPFAQAERLVARLDDPPAWLGAFVAYAATRHCVGRTTRMVSTLGRLLADGPGTPQALLERARRPGRSAGTLAHTLEGFLVAEGLAFGLDQQARLAHGRRQRRIAATPEPLRAAVARFAEAQVAAQQRARRAGTRPRADRTIEASLATLRDLAGFLVAERAKPDWATIDAADLEAFLALLPASRARRLGVLRHFFGWARTRRLVLVDPTATLTADRQRGFNGQVLAITEQRRLYHRWTSNPQAHPHECLVGMLALLHGAANAELRGLRVADIAPARRTIRLGRRPHPVPLDPASWLALERCLAVREELGTHNPHVLVTRVTKTGGAPVSGAYLAHVLDPAGVPPRRLRATRLADLVTTLDPKLVAEAFGLDPDGVLAYLADHVHDHLLAMEGGLR